VPSEPLRTAAIGAAIDVGARELIVDLRPVGSSAVSPTGEVQIARSGGGYVSPSATDEATMLLNRLPS
jgi:hypothetical protein